MTNTQLIVLSSIILIGNTIYGFFNFIMLDFDNPNSTNISGIIVSALTSISMILLLVHLRKKNQQE